MADVTLPQLGETVTEGTITQWFKQIGDTVAEDEPLFEVSTDKVDTEVPSPVSGVLTEIRVDEGDTVDVGTVIAMPIINQPQVGIISTDAIVRKPVVVTSPEGGEAIAIHPVGNLAMSSDHRAFDGAYAAGFLKHVKETLENKDWSSEL